MLSWQSILRIGCQTERLAQLRAFAIIGVILLQRRSRITMPPCEYFTLFYIQCGVYTEFGIEPVHNSSLFLKPFNLRLFLKSLSSNPHTQFYKQLGALNCCQSVTSNPLTQLFCSFSVSADMFSCTLLNRRVGHLDVSEYGLKCRK